MSLDFDDGGGLIALGYVYIIPPSYIREDLEFDKALIDIQSKYG